MYRVDLEHILKMYRSTIFMITVYLVMNRDTVFMTVVDSDIHHDIVLLLVSSLVSFVFLLFALALLCVTCLCW